MARFARDQDDELFAAFGKERLVVSTSAARMSVSFFMA